MKDAPACACACVNKDAVLTAEVQLLSNEHEAWFKVCFVMSEHS